MTVMDDENIVIIRRYLREAFSDFFGLHLIGILYKSRDKTGFELGTGFIGSFESRETLITAGHICRHVLNLRESGQLESMRFTYLCGKHELEWYSLDAEKIGPETWKFDANETVDVGSVLLPKEFFERTFRLGLQRIGSEKFQRTRKNFHEKAVVVAGMSAGDSIEVVKNRLFLVEDGRVKERQRRDVGSIGFRSVPITALENLGEETVVAETCLPDESSVQGMSGGPVLEVYHRPESRFDEFRLLGVQSTQFIESDVVKRIRFVPSAVAERSIRNLLGWTLPH